MADRSIAMLRDCLNAVRARRTRAEASHGRAIRAELAAGQARDNARHALVAVEADWQRHVRDRFDPVFGPLLAAAIGRSADRLVEAEIACANAQGASDRTATAWHREDARSSALDRQVGLARRQARRRADERVLAALADRETVRRSGR